MRSAPATVSSGDVLVALHHRERRVAEDRHDHPFGHAGGEEDRRGRVAQIVEAQALLVACGVRDAGFAADLAEGSSTDV